MDLYVSPSGNDNNAGTVNAPFATLLKAATIADHQTVIHLADGTYDDGDNIVRLRKDVRITGSRSAIVKSWLAVLSGANVYIDGVSFNQVTHTPVSAEAWDDPSAQIGVRGGASLYLEGSAATYTSGGKSFVRCEGGRAFITAYGANSLIDYSNVSGLPMGVIAGHYDSLVWVAAENNHTLEVKTGFGMAFYVSNGDLTLLECIVTGKPNSSGQASTGVHASRKSTVFINDPVMIRDCFFGVHVVKGSSAHVSEGVAFVRNNRVLVAERGSWFTRGP